MNDKAIEKLAREYAEELFKDDDLSEQETIEEKNDCFVMCMAFGGYLLEKCCIVSKEKVKELYNETDKWLEETSSPEKAHDPIRLVAVGIQSRFEQLFGTDLFKDNDNESE